MLQGLYSSFPHQGQYQFQRNRSIWIDTQQSGQQDPILEYRGLRQLS